MKQSRVLVNVVFLLVSAVIGLLVVEAALRFQNRSMTNYDIEMWRYARELKTPSPDPVLGHEHQKSKTAVLQSVSIRTNEWGLRGGPVPPVSPDRRRILLLGSSITLGWGVPEEETLPAQLEKMFHAAGRSVEVLNAGVGNYNAVRCVELFETRLTGLKPSDIVLHYFVNGAEVLEPGGGNVFLRHSELAVTLWILSNRLFGENGEGKLEEHYKKLYAPDSRGYLEMEAAVKRLSEYAKAHDIRLYMLMTPDVHNLKNYKFAYIHDIMAGLARTYGYVYVDSLPAYRGLPPERIWAMPGDPHPNALGHKLMAEALYPVLADVPAGTRTAATR